jgi:hypothetical protein
MNLPATAPVRHLPAPTEGIEIDREAVLKSLGLNPRDPNTQALLLVCERYNLDPLLKHIVLIKSNAYVTRDGYLAVAHRSGQFDGMEVLEQGENQTHFTAKVAVYRKDMGRPFAYVGRYPKAGQMAQQYGPEMAVKVAEVQALRRAFNVTGISAADEMWDQQLDAGSPADAPAGVPAAPPQYEPFTEENETLVSYGDRIAFYEEMRQALPGMKKKDVDSLRHAVVHRATRGRTASSEAVAAGEEWARVLTVFKAFVDGKLELVEVDGTLRLEKVAEPESEAS